MPPRTRLKQYQIDGGGTSKGYISNTLVADSVQAPKLGVYWKQCSDIAGSPKVDHPLSITMRRTDLTPYNGVSPNASDGFRLEFVNVFPENDAMWNPQHMDITWPDSDGVLATQLLARTNPNKYSVNGPVSLLELRELPLLLKKQGDNIIQNAAGGYLSWQFGWKPLISDVKKLLDFNGSVNKKINDLNRMYSRGGVKRRIKFGELSDHKSEDFLSYSWQGKQGTHTMNTYGSVRKWGTVRWRPTQLPPSNPAGIRRQAIRIVYGLEFSASNIWESIPWSWLVDWFTNIGTYYSTFNNVVPVEHSAPLIMTHSITNRHFVAHNSVGITGGDGTSMVESKSRALTSPTISASVPFLTGRQLSILGSLAILRLRAR
jgi:hypothetical protein